MVSKPPVVSVTEPLRITIKSSGSPEMFRLCSSPSTRPNRMHDDQTTSPVPSTVITRRLPADLEVAQVVFERNHGDSDDPPRPSMTARLAARTAG